MSRGAIALGAVAIVGVIAAGAAAYGWMTTRAAGSSSAPELMERQTPVPQVTGCDGVTYAAGGTGVDVCADPQGVLFMAGLRIEASPLSPYSDTFVGTSQCSNLILTSTTDVTLKLQLRHFAVQAPGQASPEPASSSLNSHLTSDTLEPGSVTTARVCTDTTGAGDYTMFYAPLPPNGDRGIWTSQAG